MDGGEVERERRLRALRLERREQQAELEAIVAEGDAARRTLADVVRAHGERGDRCAIDVGPHRVVGLVAHVGDDVASVLGPDGSRHDVALVHIGAVAVVEAGRATHRVGSAHPRTLLARGRELTGAGSPVEVGRVDRADPVRGRLLAVSPHVLEVDRGSAGPVVLAWSVVAWLAEG